MEDKHLQAWQERLAGCEPRELSVDREALLDTWNVEQVIDFLGWSYESFTRKTPDYRKKVLNGKGVDVIQIEGKGKKAVFSVRIRPEMLYQLLTRKVRGLEPFMADYMEKLFMQNTLLNQGTAHIVPTVEEVASEFASVYNLNPTATKKSLVEFRRQLKSYGYLATTKDMMEDDLKDALDQNPRFIFKQARAYKGKTVLKGRESIRSTQIINDAWGNLFRRLDNTHPLVGANGEKLQGNLLLDRLHERRKEVHQMIEDLKQTHGWSHLRTFYVSMVTARARADYQALQELFYMGASFSDIRAFLNDREEYWKNEGQPVEEDADDVSEELSIEEE